MEVASVLNDINQVINSPKQSTLTKHTICDLLSKYLNARAEGITVINHQWGNGLAPRVGLFCSVEFGRRLINESYPGKIFINKDIAVQPKTNETNEIYLTGIRAYVAYPVFIGDNFVSLLAIHSNQARIWTKGEIQIIENVGIYLSRV
jgi:GAF domain-containing protein